MPRGRLKNALYGAALPILGVRPGWRAGGELERVAKRRRAVGLCVQRFEGGALTRCRAVGYETLAGEKPPVTPDTVFRSASLAKLAAALLVFRLQTLGKLDVSEDIGDFWGRPARSPHWPDTPITVGMLLSHTSGLRDTPAYYAALSAQRPLDALWNADSFSPHRPGAAFAYSNLAAGMVGCPLEARFGESLEALAQRELFGPLGVRATFDPSTLAGSRVADGWRVLPPGRAFDAQARIRAAAPMSGPDVQLHYAQAAGGLYLTAAALARLALAAHDGHDGFLDKKSLLQMKTPVTAWPGEGARMRHGMGLLVIDDPELCPQRLWGHQGFAYGAVNGVFFDEAGRGFASLTTGASEQRRGHPALLNRDLIRLYLTEQRG